MSLKHPVIAVTGSSGAGTTTVKLAFENREKDQRCRCWRRLLARIMAFPHNRTALDCNHSFSHFGPRSTTSTDRRNVQAAARPANAAAHVHSDMRLLHSKHFNRLT
jgi:phosphoribulokinase